MAKIAIIGGGIAGLTTAYFLAKKGWKVTILEKEKVLGGLAASFKNEGWKWPLERYYHHFFASDKDLFQLAEELKIKNKLFFKKPITSVFIDNKIFRFDNLKSIFLFPKLNLTDKLRMGITTVFLKINPFWKPLEKITAVNFIKKTMGENVYRLIWQPLFLSKFGDLYKKIPASWFWTRVKKRSFSLGYFQEGTETLIKTISEKIKSLGGEILIDSEITNIRKDKTGFSVFLKKETKPLFFDKVIATIPPEMFIRIFPEASEDEKNKLMAFESLGSLCLVLSLKERFLSDGTYWLNINEKDFPFVAVVEHTNFIDKKNYGNQTILYVGGYYPTSHRFFKVKMEEILNEFLPYLKKINPSFDFQKGILNSKFFTATYSQPIVSLNYFQKVPSIKTSIPGLYWSSLHHVYPEDRGINYAISLGKRIANEIA